METLRIGNIDYPLLFTTNASKELDKRFGGLEKVQDHLTDETSFSEKIDVIIDLIVILANQGAANHNFYNPDAKLEPINSDIIGTLYTPVELKELIGTVMKAITAGVKREVESEPTKNAAGG